MPTHVAMLGTGDLEPSDEEPIPEETSPSSTISTTDTVIESHVPLDEEQVKTLTRGQKKTLQDDVKEIYHADRSMWNRLRNRRNAVCLPRGCGTFLMEIFAGAAVLTAMAASLQLPVSAPVDIKLDGSDLLDPKVRANLDKEIEATDPYVITFSPKCAPWCAWTNLNMSKSLETSQKIEAEREDWYPCLQWIRKLVKRRLAQGRKVLIENPWTSYIWDTFSMRRLMSEELYDHETNERLELIRGDQCQFGLVDFDNGYPHKQPTGFLTASAGNHIHQPLEGGSRTSRAQQWPEPLCMAILDGFIEELENRTFQAAFFNESLEETGLEEDIHLGTLDLVQDEHDLAPRQDLLPAQLNPEELQRQELMEEEPLRGDQEMDLEKTRRIKLLKIPRPTRLALRRLHNMTGHSSASNMMQLLRTAGATPAVVEACKHFACESCRKIQPVQRPNITKIPGKPIFNNEVSLDCLEIKDAFGNRHTVLSAIDLGTLFHQCWWVTGGGVPKSQVCADTFLNGWITPFGPPTSVVCDRGMHNQGRMKDLLRIHGILLRYTGVEAPYQLGRGERQGHIFKEILKAAVEERQIYGTVAIKQLISEACVVKNMRLNHLGFSPYQWVLGKLPLDATSLTSEESEGRFLGTTMLTFWSLKMSLQNGSTFVKQPRKLSPRLMQADVSGQPCSESPFPLEDLLHKVIWCAFTDEADGVDLEELLAKKEELLSGSSMEECPLWYRKPLSDRLQALRSSPSSCLNYDLLASDFEKRSLIFLIKSTSHSQMT